MKIKFTKEVDTEEMYKSMMTNIFKYQGRDLPYWLISDETILKEFEREWENETHTKACDTVSIEEIIIILHEFKEYVKNHIFEKTTIDKNLCFCYN